jgi:isoleucyl-tRNA synthetase
MTAPVQKSPFQKVAAELDFPSAESKILQFWKENRIFEKSLDARKGCPTFVFYEGPPTANGMPHNGHVLTRAIKDLFPRYKTMRGFSVPRKAGWDTHGLPVEVEVEKDLRIHGKADIERYGVAPFVIRCVDSVFRYTAEWERLTERIGFWVDLGEAYVTYHRQYVESVWWALANLYEKGLLYRGHKVVWWWAQGGTALSSAEVGLGYRQVDDPAVFVAFPLVDEPGTSLLVWTTTPWTLPSNMYAAVKSDVEYVTVQDGDRRFIIAAALRAALEQKLKRELDVTSTFRGEALVGKRYKPPFSYHWDKGADRATVRLAQGGTTWLYYRVVAADFVTLDTGTGIVHIAPAFGEDDYDAYRRETRSYENGTEVENPPLCTVGPDGKFRKSDFYDRYDGMWVKDADNLLVADLKERGLLVHKELCRHDYPYCWRADDDPLIQYARPTWYIRTTAKIGDAIANNRKVNWLPDHIKEGRFGDFLANNVDWALSRERYWGTPLPLWVNERGDVEAIASLEQLRNKPGSNLADVEKTLARQTGELSPGRSSPLPSKDLIVHKPWIDQVEYGNAQTGRFKRVPEVIDCWFDSGCMPFAQWGFPHAPGSKEKFDKAFPADFISEAIDQTRGWFYSLLMISTLVFDEKTVQCLGFAARPLPHPYKTCIVLGHVSDKEGKKESKSKGNYTPPEVILERVAMDFAVVDTSLSATAVADGEVLIGREDIDGLDVAEGTKLAVHRPDRPEQKREFVVRIGKKLPRRVVVVGAQDAEALGVRAASRGLDIKPSEVSRLPAEERLTVIDEATPAPGSDAFRWFFYAASPPWSNVRHSLGNVRALQKDFPVKLRNVYSFFTIYAAIDGWSPAGDARLGFVPPKGRDLPTALRAAPASSYTPVSERCLLDRWILSELHSAVDRITAHMDAYEVFESAQTLVELTESLSNWYVRRARERFWAPLLGNGLPSNDKQDAYATLYEALVTITLLSAPFIPFMAEEMYQNLVRGPWPDGRESSIHLEAFPTPNRDAIDQGLADEMRIVRELVSLGLQVRTQSRLKVRQPIGQADIVLARQDMVDKISVDSYASLIRNELNVEHVHFRKAGEESSQVCYRLKPNFRALGPKLGKKVQQAKKALEQVDAGALRVEMITKGFVTLDLDGEKIEIAADELEVSVEAKKGFAAAGSRAGVVVLHTALTQDLIDKGLAREVLSRVQLMRKELDLGYTVRIRLSVSGSPRITRLIEQFEHMIASEALVEGSIERGPPGFAVLATRVIDLDSEHVTVDIGRAI